MAVDTFIPEVWAAELLVTLEKSYVFGQPGVTNRDYEGDISQYGDTVHIGYLTDPTVATYTKNSTSIDPATLATTDDTMAIDQSKYFAFELDDVDARQVRNSGDLFTKATQRAGSLLRDTADQYLATLMAAGAGTIFDPLYLEDGDTGANSAFRLLRQMRAELTRNNVPTSGRFAIISPDFEGLLLGDNRFIDASRYGSTEPIRNGEIGRAMGFAIMLSNNLPEGTYAGSPPAYSNYVIAGHPMATTFAEQISKTEAYRPQNAFSDAVKGLHLYGGKVVRPEALVACDVDVDLGE